MSPAEANPDFVPEITVLYCGRSLADEQSARQGTLSRDGYKVKLVLLPCSSKMEAYQMLELIKQGADALVLAACPQGACRFLVGNDRARKRVEYARDLLEQAGMGAARLSLKRGAGRDLDALLELAAGAAEEVRPMGPNPMKGDHQ